MKDRLHHISGLVIKEFLQLFRNRLLLAFVVLAPLMELVLVGSLTGAGVRNLPVAVVDLDRSRASRELITRLDQTDELLVSTYGETVAQAQDWMQSGSIAVIVVVPPGYGEALTSSQLDAEVQVVADGSSHVVSTVAIATTENAAAEIARDLTSRHPFSSEGPVSLNFVARFNALLDDRPQSITSILAVIILEVTLIIAAQSFTREREVGTLEQLRVTPLDHLELLVGKGIPTLLIGLVNSLLMIGIVVLWLDIPLRGSLLLLMLLTLPFVLAQVGWGTLISLISHTQQQATLFVFALAMLEVALSGFLVPASDMPGAVRLLSYASSVQHYLVVLRGVMLRGAGLGALWPQALALVGIGLAVSALAWLRLRLGLGTDSLRWQLPMLWRARRRTRREQQAARSIRRSTNPG